MALALHYLTLISAMAVAVWALLVPAGDPMKAGAPAIAAVIVLMLLVLDALWRAELVDWR